MMGIVVPETRWAYKNYNKIISGIFGFYSLVITMLHGPTNIKTGIYVVWSLNFFSGTIIILFPISSRHGRHSVLYHQEETYVQNF